MCGLLYLREAVFRIPVKLEEAGFDLIHSMSRRGNCHDNAVAESFFNLLKRERIRRRVYRSEDEVRQNVFDYIEMLRMRKAST